MAESLRDLVVSLSLNSDNFTRNIRSVNKQLKEAESYFKLAGAGVKNFESSTAGTSAKISMLQRSIGLQQNVVYQYERSLAQANAKLQESTARQADYSNRLANAKAVLSTYTDAQGEFQRRLSEARQEYDSASQEVQTYSDMIDSVKSVLDESDPAMKDLNWNLEEAQKRFSAASEEVGRLEQEYKDAEGNVELLSGQCDALSRASQNAADAVSTQQTQLNRAQTALIEMQTELRRLQSAWTQAGTSLTAFSEKLGNLSQTTGKVGRFLTNNLTKPIVSLGKNAINASLEFESSFASVRKTVNATDREFEILEEASKQLSTEVVATTSEINAVMSTAGQLGIQLGENGETLIEFTRAMIDLGNSCTDLSADDAATTIAKFANVMQTDKSKFTNIGSTLVELGNNFATTERPIMEMAQRLSGAAKQVGLSEAQVLGFATALSSVGIEAQQGGSSFSKALVKMEVAAQTGGKSLTDFSNICGLSEKQFVQMWSEDPAEVFQMFIEGLAKMDEEGASAIAVLSDIGISEIRLRDTLLRSVNATDLFTRAQVMAKRAWEENTALTTKASKRYATTASQIQNLKNKATLFTKQLGDDLNPTIKKLISGADSLIEKFLALDYGQRQNLIRTAATVASIGPAFLAFSKLTKGISVVTGGLGKFCTAVGEAGGGFSGLTKVLSRSPGFWIAAAAAVAIGTAALVDYASGAKRAREAVKQLTNAAQEWEQTNATTSYESSKGMYGMGLTEDDFNPAKQGAENWLDSVREVWNDGKRDTDELVQQMTEGFTKETDALSEAISLSNHPDAEKDIKTLQGMNTEVEKLLKKRQNGTITDKEFKRLQQLIDERGELEIKYHFAPVSNGFEEITKQVGAALSRNEDTSTVWADSYAAASQGMQAFSDQLKASYDEQYKAIMADTNLEKDVRDQKLKDLREWYDAQKKLGEDSYRATLKNAAEQTGVFGEGGIYDQTQKDLLRIRTLILQIGEGEVDQTKAVEELSKITKGMDEAKLAEFVAAMAVLGSDAPEDAQNASQAFQTIQDSLTGLTVPEETMNALNMLFGEGLAEEVHEINATLNTSSLDNVYDTWAAGQHADIIPGISTETLGPIDVSTVPLTGSLIIDGELGTVTGAKGKKYKVVSATVLADGSLATVTAEDGKTYYVTSSSVKADGTLGEVTGEDGKTYKVSGVKATVDGALGAVTGKDGTTYQVTGATVLADGTLHQIIVDNDKTYSVVNVDGVLQAVTMSPEAQLPTVEVQGVVKYTNTRPIATGSDYKKSNKAIFGRKDVNFLGIDLGQTTNALENLNQLYGRMVKSGAKNVKQFTAGDRNANLFGMPLTDMKSATTVMAQITTGLQKMSQGELDEEHVQQLQSLVTTLQQFGALDPTNLDTLAEVFNENGEGTFFEGVENGDALAVRLAEAMRQAGALSQPNAEQVGDDVSAGLAIGMEGYDFTGAATNVADNTENSLRDLFESSSPARRMIPLGNDIAAGIGVGLKGYGFSTETEALSSNLQSGIATALASIKTSDSANIGKNIALGVATGITSSTYKIKAAAIKAAKEALKAAKDELGVESPSRKFRDEVGVMAAKGMAIGITQESKRQARAVSNAARYMTNAAKSGVVGATTNDNRRSYTDNSAVNLTVGSLSIRDEQDIQSLAREIAALTRRGQVGRGLKMA